VNEIFLNLPQPRAISYFECVGRHREPSKLWHLLEGIKPADLTWAAWTRRAQVSTSFFQDVKRGVRPSVENLERVVEAIGMSPAQFYALDAPTRQHREPGIGGVQAPPARFLAPRDEDPTDIPLLGTAQAADFEVTDEGHMSFAEQMEVHLDEVLDTLRRPIALAGRKGIYAITVRGTSMRPKFEDGDPIYVDAGARPMIGDIVVLQLVKRDDFGEPRIASVLIKALVRRTPEFVELEQYNPPLIFRVAMKEIAHMHRWVPWREMVAV
jgi:phage repressor protein C with HTH and peptisase S24 domain